MPKLIVYVDDVAIKEQVLVQPKTKIGRRPYNDLVIDNLAVSGEHAVVEFIDSVAWLEDLESTNGTYVNGHAIARHALQDQDEIEVGKYKIRYVESAESGASTTEEMDAVVRVLSGTAAGKEMKLMKVVSTIGKPGVAVAAITRRNNGFSIASVDGIGLVTLNGKVLEAEPRMLRHADQIELAGVQMQFLLTSRH